LVTGVRRYMEKEIVILITGVTRYTEKGTAILVKRVK